MEATQYKDLDLPARILLGPGPSMVSSRVLRAMATPPVGYMDPTYLAVMQETKELLRYIFQTKNTFTIPISGTGSAGMETCFVNLVEPGDPVLILINGVFGKRMQDLAKETGMVVVDEEHRFGVRQKEKMKKLRNQVDVLSLSATPIPRTLQMGFTNVRDLSVIETPPADRQAVRTRLARFDDEVIREAIRRELLEPHRREVPRGRDGPRHPRGGGPDEPFQSLAGNTYVAVRAGNTVAPYVNITYWLQNTAVSTTTNVSRFRVSAGLQFHWNKLVGAPGPGS